MDGYIERMQAKENQCLALIQQADQVLEAMGFSPPRRNAFSSSGLPICGMRWPR